VIAPRTARGLAAWLARLRRGSRPRPGTLDEARVLADPARVRRILAIKVHDQLGDFLVATPALAALRARYPTAELTLLTRSYLAPLAARQAAPDRLLVFTPPLHPAMPASGPGVLWGACVPRPDLAVVLNSVSRSRTADLFAALSGAPLVVGRSHVGAGPPPDDAPPSAVDGARVAADPVYDVDLPIARGSGHQVERVLDLVRWLGANAEHPQPTLVLRAQDRERGAAALGVVHGKGPRVGLHPAAANPLKCWPIESFAALGAALAGEPHGARLFVLDTPKEPGPAHDLVAALAARGVAATLVPPLPLGVFAGACAGLDLVACNDSGVMHVAAAVGTAVLSFHSLGRPAEWAPRAPGRTRALHAEPIAGIAVAEAVAAAIPLLGR
jgi:ADP-heptose:LPS heptosyltransferase